MLIKFDIRTNPGIIKIVWENAPDDQNNTVYYMDSVSVQGIVTEEGPDIFSLKNGNDGAAVYFKDFVSMKPYLDQIQIMFNTAYDPFKNGPRKSPYFQNLGQGDIMHHTYITTDVEKELLGAKK